MASLSESRLKDCLKREGNDRCADCTVPTVAKDWWASMDIQVFICKNCAGIHRSMGTSITRVKSVFLDSWTEENIQNMENGGNIAAAAKYEQMVPAAYKRPTPTDPQVLKEEWIRAKYERLEFQNVDRQTYLRLPREGYLMKRGRDNNKFLPRRFQLNDTSLQYYNKEDPSSSPKNILPLDSLNVSLAPEKVHERGMQITYSDKKSDTRCIYVYGESSKDTIDWFMAIRAAKLARLHLAYPSQDIETLKKMISCKFTKEGWLSKSGPNAEDAYRKRWCILDNRKFMYFVDPLNAFPKGEIHLGTSEQGFVVREGVPPGDKDLPFSFTLKTPQRNFRFGANDDVERHEWIVVLKRAIDDLPQTPQETREAAKGHRKRMTSILRR